MKKVLLVVLAVVLVSSVSMAQLSAGKLAITTDIPGNSIGAAYALSENMRIDGGVTFQSTSVAGTSATAFGIGANVKLYHPAVENVTYFYGGGVSFSTVGDPAITSLGLKAIGGAEYWFSSRFAIGGYVSAGYSSVGPSGTKVNTFGTMGVGTTWTWWIN